MQIHHLGYRVKGFYRLAGYALRHGMKTPLETAQYRLKILRFRRAHGLAATQAAFGVSRRTLFLW